MKYKKGSITIIFIILLSISNLLLRINRLVISHTFLEKGIYSVDEREFSNKIILEEIEDELNLIFDSKESFMDFFKYEKTLKIKGYEIKKDELICDTIILNIKNTKNSYVIKGEAYYDEKLCIITLKRSNL